jgi:glyoxylase-like metal-dependent hydrolase (beta-lactamase superfamily II)
MGSNQQGKTMNRYILGAVIGIVAAASLSTGAAVAQKAPKRSITNIAGDLYQFKNNFHTSVFYVTSEGVIATDPINAGAARWLKAEIKKRFNQPIKYVIYSHDHPDHISGGEVFADTATVISHAKTKSAIVGEKRPTAVPNVTFTDNMTVELGGKKVELTYLGKNHSDNMIVMRFPAERVLFAVDFIPIRTVAFRTLGDAYIPEWMESIKRVEAMDFDILAQGHGPSGNKADATAFRGYMEDLYAAVLAGIRSGKSLDELKTGIKLPKYEKWQMYGKWMPENIQGVYNQIRMHRRPG